MSLPANPNDLFEDGILELGAGQRLDQVSFVGATVYLDITDPYDGRARIALSPPTTSPIAVFYDEPPGAGADPYGRPDPKTHPEYWTE